MYPAKKALQQFVLLLRLIHCYASRTVLKLIEIKNSLFWNVSLDHTNECDVYIVILVSI